MGIEYLETRRDRVKALQQLLVARATHESANDALYAQLRRDLLGDSTVAPRLPRYVRTCGDLGQFWQFIKYERGTYVERRTLIWDDFRPILDHLDAIDGATPAYAAVSEGLERFDTQGVHAVWQKALERRMADPEGAITVARTLLETVCKHILDECTAPYPDDADLPKLYRLTAERLQLAPSQHTEQVFKQILGGCQSVVEGLGAARNRLSDAHGQGKRSVRPAPRHAELAVNLAGSMALFLVDTLEARQTGM